MDRHTVHCGTGYVINYIKLERNPKHNQIRYSYKCCKSQLSCYDVAKTNGISYNGHWTIQCNNMGSGISYLKLDRTGNNWNERYDCCRVHYDTRSSLYCYPKITSYSIDGDSENVYKDRQIISCNSDKEFVPYMVHNSSKEKIIYYYYCCRFNTPYRQTGEIDEFSQTHI